MRVLDPEGLCNEKKIPSECNYNKASVMAIDGIGEERKEGVGQREGRMRRKEGALMQLL